MGEFEFKVGDKVRVVRNIGHPDYDCNIGKEFDVLAVDEEDVDINAPGIFGTDSSTWHFSELELVREGEKPICGVHLDRKVFNTGGI